MPFMVNWSITSINKRKRMQKEGMKRILTESIAAPSGFDMPIASLDKSSYSSLQEAKAWPGLTDRTVQQRSRFLVAVAF